MSSSVWSSINDCQKKSWFRLLLPLPGPRFLERSADTVMYRSASVQMPSWACAYPLPNPALDSVDAWMFAIPPVVRVSVTS